VAGAAPGSSIATAEDLQPIVEATRILGQLTYHALPVEQEMDWARTEYAQHPHTSAKIAELQRADDPTILCQRLPIMCSDHSHDLNTTLCHQQRHTQLVNGCAHEPGCIPVTCDLSGQFHVNQLENMQCVDPDTGVPTGKTWRHRPCA
jgi:hypothetical protein